MPMPLASKPSRSKVVILGDTKVGKTALTSRYIRPEDTPSDEYVATIGIDFSAKAVKVAGGDSIRLQIWDTAGAERYFKLSAHYLQDAAAVMVVYDVAQRKTFDNVRSWIELVEETFDGKSPPLLVLVGNKIDLQSGVVTTQEGKDLASELGAHAFFEVSAKEGRNVHELFQNMASLLLTAPSPTLLGAASDGFGMEPVAVTREEHVPKRCRCWPF